MTATVDERLTTAVADFVGWAWYVAKAFEEVDPEFAADFQQRVRSLWAAAIKSAE